MSSPPRRGRHITYDRILENALPGGLENSGWKAPRYRWLTRRLFKCRKVWLNFSPLPFFGGICVLANQPIVHSGGVIGGGLWLWQLALVTGDRWQGTGDRQQVTHDTWHMTIYIYIYLCQILLDFLVLVLLSAHVKSFSFSFMRDGQTYTILIITIQRTLEVKKIYKPLLSWALFTLNFKIWTKELWLSKTNIVWPES